MSGALVLGRIGVDFTPTEPRTSLADATTFVRAVGGFAGNIAIGLARLGVPTGVVSAVGDDGHGEHVRQALLRERVDADTIVVRSGSRTQVAFFEAWPPERFPVTFHRATVAPETTLSEDDLPNESIMAASIVIVSGALLAEEPARRAVLSALSRRAATGPSDRAWTILDLDWRPTLWPDPEEYPTWIAQAATAADVLIGGDGEFAAAGLDPLDVLGPDSRTRLVVLKHGPAGVSLLSRDGRRTLPGIPVEVVCGLGSGDALTAAFAAGLLGGLDPRDALARANAAGAIVASRLMCSDAMPTPGEIDALLASAGSVAVEVGR